MTSRSLRQKPRINYYEPEEPQFDEYVYCERCSDYVFEYCAIHGPLLVIPDEKIFGTNNKRLHVVDAADSEHSNWMRYVNCSRHWTEQNLVAYQYKGHVYYRTIKIIPRFTELLVFYGSEFANLLSINVSKYNLLPYYKTNIDPHMKRENISRNPTDLMQTQTSNEKDNQKVNDSDEQLFNFNDFQIIDNSTTVVGESVFETNNFDLPRVSNIKHDLELEQIFECEYCKKRFLKKQYLKRHSLSHLPVQKYQCQQCPYTTSISYTFKRHSLTHSNRIYSCSLCSFKTRDSSTLIAHICYQKNKTSSYYSVARPCDLCPFSTLSRKSFQTHILKHKGITYKCHLCDYINYSKANFDKHLLRKHKAVSTM